MLHQSLVDVACRRTVVSCEPVTAWGGGGCCTVRLQCQDLFLTQSLDARVFRREAGVTERSPGLVSQLCSQMFPSLFEMVCSGASETKCVNVRHGTSVY